MKSSRIQTKDMMMQIYKRKLSSSSSSFLRSSMLSSRSDIDSDGCIYPEGISEIPYNLQSETSPYILKVLSQDGMNIYEGVELESDCC